MFPGSQSGFGRKDGTSYINYGEPDQMVRQKKCISILIDCSYRSGNRRVQVQHTQNRCYLVLLHPDVRLAAADLSLVSPMGALLHTLQVRPGAGPESSLCGRMFHHWLPTMFPLICFALLFRCCGDCQLFA